MAFSNAEKQARWRERRDARIAARIQELETTVARQAAEIARLQARPQAAPAPKPARPARPAPQPAPVLDPDSKAAFEAAVDAEIKKRDRAREIAFRQRVFKEASHHVKPFRPFTEAEHRLLTKVFHPDGTVSKDKTGEAFRIWNSRKDVLVKKELPGGPPQSPLPSADEFRARQAAREAAKQASRRQPATAPKGRSSVPSK
jgi:hypothetical protein